LKTSNPMDDENIYMIWGGNGWIGGLLTQQYAAQGKTLIHAKSRLENRQHMEEELELHMPTRVLCAAGLTGRPNVDWCEVNQVFLDPFSYPPRVCSYSRLLCRSIFPIS